MSVEPTSVTFRDGYIELILAGVSAGVHSHYREIHAKAFAASREHRCGRILIDASGIDYNPNVLLEHQTAMDLAQQCAAHPFRVIVATVSPAHVEAANEHLETAARNRGVNLRVFTSREAALAWLTATETGTGE